MPEPDEIRLTCARFRNVLSNSGPSSVVTVRAAVDPEAPIESECAAPPDRGGFKS
jgi:hypothetical protein